MVREFQFYIVPTPIGNIKDITHRAIEVLNEVDLIACEDSRVTQKLLNHYNIKTDCISYHKYNEKERVSYLLKTIKEGKRVALVSDAGTPMICDPGSILISELVKNGISVNSLPGACVIPTFLSCLPRENEEFIFLGFISRTENEIVKKFSKYKDTNIVFYDSPNRIKNTLKILETIRPDAKVAVGRELTKVFEEVVILPVGEAIEVVTPKGEFVALVYGENLDKPIDIENKISALKSKGYSAKDVSIILSTLYPACSKNEIYKLAI